MGFHHVTQAGLELLASSDPPALASQSAAIPGVTVPVYYFLMGRNMFTHKWYERTVFKVTAIYKYSL